jgi:formylglycine-generating enzyme required for sulfatase activity
VRGEATEFVRERTITAALIFALALLALFPSQCAAQQAIPTAQELQNQQHRPVGHPAVDEDMAMIPGATVQMGIDAPEIARFQKLFEIKEARFFEPEVPKHTVTIDSFYMDRHLVTNSQFRKFIEESLFWQPDRIPSRLHNGNYLRHWEANDIPLKRANHPVVNVSWYAAVAYCQGVGKRLPTEAEWEHAARGKLNGLFPWGDEPVDKGRANYSDSSIGTTTAVGSYPANGHGLFDMAGNVWEYLADEWRPYSSNAQRNPVAGGDLFLDGDAFLRIKTRRVIRGGSWDGAPVNLWVDYRDSHPPEGARDFVGFRCAKSLGKDDSF